jgi:hypothetical protein
VTGGPGELDPCGESFWSELYRTGDTRFDKGRAAPPIVGWHQGTCAGEGARPRRRTGARGARPGRLGWEVTAVDIAPEACRDIEAQARAAGLSIDVRCEDALVVTRAAESAATRRSSTHLLLCHRPGPASEYVEACADLLGQGAPAGALLLLTPGRSAVRRHRAGDPWPLRRTLHPGAASSLSGQLPGAGQRELESASPEARGPVLRSAGTTDLAGEDAGAPRPACDAPRCRCPRGVEVPGRCLAPPCRPERSLASLASVPRSLLVLFSRCRHSPAAFPPRPPERSGAGPRQPDAGRGAGAVQPRQVLAVDAGKTRRGVADWQQLGVARRSQGGGGTGRARGAALGRGGCSIARRWR